MRVVVREVTRGDAERLARLLCEDEVLRGELGVPEGDRPTGEGFWRKIEAWCERNRAVTFAILRDGAAVGTISLSHRSEDGKRARIGYWVGSAHRRCGVATAAFGLVVAMARESGVERVSVTIEKTNEASIRLWRRWGAREGEVEGREGWSEFVLGIGGGEGERRSSIAR
ncbi:MAG: GNAT family N-acetyltransferase [Phycisphaeraceae bacterium]|nr:GNAT family N-acetyltransferase [Phycisphaeraceae bacterium]